MILDWSIPFTLKTPFGDLDFNKPMTNLGLFLLDGANCLISSDARVTRDVIPQASGGIIHRRFDSGLAMHLAVQLYEDEHKQACDTVLRKMDDFISGCLNSILNADGRVIWQPPGYGDKRILDRVRRLEPLLPGPGNSETLKVVTFAVESPFPYAIDITQSDNNLNVTVTNVGSCDFYPVFKVHGPTGAFTLQNANALDDAGAPMKIIYDSTLPGASAIAGGNYVEIDCFRDTVYLNGNQANMKPGIDIKRSDFFPLVPGPNALTLTGSGTAEILWNNAWA